MTDQYLALIPARGGSKRIPDKNRREFLGKPILCYSIEAALEAGIFCEVMVSTDDAKIAKIARDAGASVPFFRSGATAGDYATTDAVIAEVLSCYAQRGRHFNAFCCIYPTAPFVTAPKLRTAMSLLQQAESVVPVVPFSYPVWRGFTCDDNGRLHYQWPQYATTRSQDLSPLYHDCGQFYACRTDAFLREGTTETPDTLPLFLPELEVQDIDTLQDWEIAELKYKKMLEKNQ